MRLVALGLIFVLESILGSAVADGQPSSRVPRVGYLAGGAPLGESVEAFRRGLRELGYVEDQTIRVEYRFAGGRPDRIPQLAAELVNSKVELIVTEGSNAAWAVRRLSKTIPIVVAATGDPVQAGLATSMARPGGNVTGLSDLSPELSGKRLELLREAFPASSHVGFLLNPDNPNQLLLWSETQAAARALGITVDALRVRRAEDLAPAFQQAAKGHLHGLIVARDFMFEANQARILGLAAQSRLPAMFAERGWAAAGGLMSYGPSQADLFRRAATYVDRILKGATPAELPFEQPTKFELVVNRKTARALALTIPQSILLRADEVIE